MSYNYFYRSILCKEKTSELGLHRKIWVAGSMCMFMCVCVCVYEFICWETEK